MQFGCLAHTVLIVPNSIFLLYFRLIFFLSLSFQLTFLSFFGISYIKSQFPIHSLPTCCSTIALKTHLHNKVRHEYNSEAFQYSSLLGVSNKSMLSDKSAKKFMIISSRVDTLNLNFTSISKLSK